MVEATLDSKNLAWDPFVLVRLLIQFVRCPLLFGYRPRTFSIVLSLYMALLDVLVLSQFYIYFIFLLIPEGLVRVKQYITLYHDF